MNNIIKKCEREKDRETNQTIDMYIGMFSFRSETGPDRGPARIRSDRTGLVLVGPVFGPCFCSISVFGPVPGWIGGPKLRLFFLFSPEWQWHGQTVPNFCSVFFHFLFLISVICPVFKWQGQTVPLLCLLLNRRAGPRPIRSCLGPINTPTNNSCPKT